jgi:hypothetical protein
VITVAPQNDICPHGRTYPINAVAININIIIIPDVHVDFFFFLEEKYIPRAVWIYRIKNINEAVFVWINRVIHPLSTFRMIISTELKDSLDFVRKCIDNITPVMICIDKDAPRRNPEFHSDEIEDGVGRSVSELFIVLII